MQDWPTVVEAWVAEFGAKSFRPAAAETLDAASAAVGALPSDLRGLLEASNGLTWGWFDLLPVFDRADVKRTWDSLQRANDPERTRFLGGDRDLLSRFLVFASLDASGCAVIDRQDGSIWYQEQGELHQTTVGLAEFVFTCLREVRDL